MARIRASCPACGDVELTTDDVQIRTWAEAEQGEYQFGCPICDRLIVKTAEPHTLDLLAASGVVVLPVAPNPLHPAAAKRLAAAPLSHDDLLDFHQNLADDTALTAALHELVQDVEP